ncbi:MAG TPA: DUF3800 domain-containing protein [Longimicrobium sp.]|jgi:hypothetical protein|uniref:DUF3800 domain-containing protein n=1 Tax=Longimicrobium sp. TaxID=2029185 RepID=UPI002EDA314E
MYLIYVDESGDPGLVNSPCRYFELSGLILHELSWRPALQHILRFRQEMRDRFGLKLREELHAARMINKPGALARIKRNDRLTIIRAYADVLACIPGLNVINVVVDKEGKQADYGVFECAWTALLERFDTTIAARNFTGPDSGRDRGLLIVDGSGDKRLRQLVRRLRAQNHTPSARHRAGNRSLIRLIEDPVFRNSEDAYLIQAVDLIAFLLYQELVPSGYMRKKSGQNYFSRLEPILCRAAVSRDPRGIVRL